MMNSDSAELPELTKNAQTNKSQLLGGTNPPNWT